MTRLVREKELVKLLPVCRATLWRWAKIGKIPRPSKVGEGVTVWDLDSIEAALSIKLPSTSTQKGNTMNKVFLKQEVKDLINAKLRNVLIIRQDGQCEYPAGWDDASIATVVGGTATAIGVKRLRQANFGRLFKGAKPTPPPVNLLAEPSELTIAELRADIEKLQRESRAVRRWIKDNFDVVLSTAEPLPLKAKE